MAIDEIIRVIAVRDRGMAARLPMAMILRMAVTIVLRRATRRVRRGYRDRMLLDRASRGMMQMPVMQVIDVVLVPNRGMSAVRPMEMRMVRVRRRGTRSGCARAAGCFLRHECLLRMATRHVARRMRDAREGYQRRFPDKRPEQRQTWAAARLGEDRAMALPARMRDPSARHGTSPGSPRSGQREALRPFARGR